MTQPKRLLNNSDFFRMFSRRAVEAVKVPEALDDEVKGILNHVRDATLEQLAEPSEELGDGEVVEVVEAEGTEL